DRLTSLRRDMRRIYLEPPSEVARRNAEREAESILAVVRAQVAAYEALPSYPGEPQLQTRLEAALDQIEAAAKVTFGAPAPEEARRLAMNEFLPAVDEGYQTVDELIRLNAQAAGRSARAVIGAHEHASRWSFVLTLVFLGVISGVWTFTILAGKRM